ncbi:MAG TPA: hypothetical protein VIC26_11360, partial [Marinagarivorans sp.]
CVLTVLLALTTMALIMALIMALKDRCRGCYRVDKGEFYYVIYDGLPSSIIPAINASLLESKPKLLDRFNISAMSPVVVRIWGNKEKFLAEQEATIGVRHPESTGYVTFKQGDKAGEMRLLNLVGETAKTAVHELAHLVTLEVNPSFANNPRWLWESLAIYATEPRWERAQFFNSHRNLFDAMAQELFEGRDTGSIYSIGYTIGEYIEATWGREALISLIQSNGDFSVVTQKSLAEVFSDWRQFVAARYFLQRSPSAAQKDKVLDWSFGEPSWGLH